jgi:hypothetical protein
LRAADLFEVQGARDALLDRLDAFEIIALCRRRQYSKAHKAGISAKLIIKISHTREIVFANFVDYVFDKVYLLGVEFL